MREVVALVVSAAVVGCTPSTGTSASSGKGANATAADAASEDGAVGARPDEHGAPEPIRVDVVRAICASATCAGKLSRLRVFYTDKGRVHRYAHDGDVTACSHPPTTVYDTEGRQVGGIPLEPVVPGSAREKELAAEWDRMFGGARHLVTVDCTGKVSRKN